MSSFHPINLTENSKRDSDEDDKQTKELQVEQGFKLFEQALRLQKNEDFEGAEAKYSQLFKLDVIKQPLPDNPPPQMRSLRYLAYKNRGLLSLSIQKSKVDPEESLASAISPSLDLLLTAIDSCDSPDPDLSDALYSIFKSLGSARLARHITELALLARPLLPTPYPPPEKVRLDKQLNAPVDLQSPKESIERDTLALNTPFTLPALIDRSERLYDNAKKNSATDPLLLSVYDTTDRLLIQHEQEEEVAVVEVHPTRAPVRASKRQNDVELSVDKFKELNSEIPRVEIEYVNGLLGIPCDLFKHVIETFVADENDLPTPELGLRTWVHDLNYCFRNWDKQKLNILLGKKSPQLSMRDILAKLGEKVKALQEMSSPSALQLKIVQEIISEKHLDSNIYQFRFRMLEAVLALEDDSGQSVLLLDKLPEITLQQIYRYIDYYFHVLRARLEAYVIHAGLESRDSQVTAVLVLEALVEQFLQSGNEGLEKKIHRWATLTDKVLQVGPNDMVLWIRYKWALVQFLQGVSDGDGEEERLILVEVKDKIGKMDFGIEYPNYPHIPSLSPSSITSLLKRITVLQALSKLTLPSASQTLPASTIENLEIFVLPEDPENPTDDQKSVREFIRAAPFEVQIQLKDVLSEHYYREKDRARFFASFLNTTVDVAAFLESEEYAQLSESGRALSLLKSLRYYGDLMEKAMYLTEEAQWALPTVSRTQFLALFKILSVLLVFYLNKVAFRLLAISNSFVVTYPRAAKELASMTVNAYSLVFLCFKQLYLSKTNHSVEGEKKIVEAVSNIHALLGFCGICDYALGRFLRLLKEELLRNTSTNTDLEIYQLVRCLHGYTLTLDYFVAYDHQADKKPLTRKDALRYCPSFLKLASEKRDPYFNSYKSDLKAILDALYEAIGPPDKRKERYVRADAILETFLCSSLTPDVFKKAFYGLLNPGISRYQDDCVFQKVADMGFYYVQGAMALVLFKIRKRSMQSRAAELDIVVEMLKSDLMCGTNRMESWLLLGQTYGFLVEDDLVWTLDKLNGDRKNTTAVYQKRALLCYLMALSVYAQMSEEERKKRDRMISLVWSLLARELYNSVAKPMGRLAYIISTNPRLLLVEGAIKESYTQKPMERKLLFRTALLIFQMAYGSSTEKWQELYYILKIEGKLDKDVKKVLLTLLKACTSAMSCSSQEPVLEPHYRLVSVVYKSVLKGKISKVTALEWLLKDSFLEIRDSESLLEMLNRDELAEEAKVKLFTTACILMLKALLTHDKKKWHHRPHFRISKMYLDMGDIEAAKQEMQQLVLLRSTTKNLVTIWKSEFERPGKHFLYARDYVVFFISLLERSEALSTLCLVLKKLRRFGSGMIDMFETWERACHVACIMTKKRLKVETGYTDSILGGLLYLSFLEESEALLHALQNEGAKLIGERLIILLYEVSEIRRMNNGFAATAEIDDTFIAVYLKVYEKFLEKKSKGETKQVESSTNSATSEQSKDTKEEPKLSKGGYTKLKVARRDVYPRALAIMKMMASDIERLQSDWGQGFDGDVSVEGNIEGDEDIKAEIPSESKDSGENGGSEAASDEHKGTVNVEGKVSPKKAMEDNGFTEVDGVENQKQQEEKEATNPENEEKGPENNSNDKKGSEVETENLEEKLNKPLKEVKEKIPRDVPVIKPAPEAPQKPVEVVDVDAEIEQPLSSRLESSISSKTAEFLRRVTSPLGDVLRNGIPESLAARSNALESIGIRATDIDFVERVKGQRYTPPNYRRAVSLSLVPSKYVGVLLTTHQGSSEVKKQSLSPGVQPNKRPASQGDEETAKRAKVAQDSELKKQPESSDKPKPKPKKDVYFIDVD